MNKIERLRQLEATSAAQTRYKLTLAGGNSIILRDLGDCIARCFREPGAPKVLHFEPLHAEPYNILELTIPILLNNQPTEKDFCNEN